MYNLCTNSSQITSESKLDVLGGTGLPELPHSKQILRLVFCLHAFPRPPPTF